jgi:tRNA(Ile)-lysidine synthase
MMLDKIAMILGDECLLDANATWLVGVSGGPDSVCLLHLLHSQGYHLIAAHVNHGLRPEAEQEARSVGYFVHGLGIDFISSCVDVRSFADEQSLSIEEAARRLRYQYLFEQAEKTSASAVLIAHNADDQVETILMHLLRGSGLTGLRGMEYRTLPNPWSDRIPLVRPLISTWREEILAYLAEHDIGYISDQSNFDTTFFRNRLRHELFPILEEYNPRIRENLLRMSQINKEDYAVIQQLVADAWQANFVKRGQGYIAFRLQGFQQLLPSIQRYLLRKAIGYHLPSLRDVDYDSIERGVNFLGEGKPGGQTDLIAGLRLLKEGDIFWLVTWQANLPGVDFPGVSAGDEIELAVPGVISLNDGWVLRAKAETDPGESIPNSYANIDPFQAWLDLDQVQLPLLIRNRKVGERFQPLGMHGHSLKVSDLMVNLKLPKRARSTWPLICSGREIVWIPGYRQSHLGRIKPSSLRIIHLALSKKSAA